MDKDQRIKQLEAEVADHKKFIRELIAAGETGRKQK